MTLINKPDWEETKQRYMAWWAHEALDRCALYVTAPKDGVARGVWPPRPSDPVQYWTDLDYMSKCRAVSFQTSYWGGEAFPVWHPGYPGHTSIPAFLGCPTTLTFETGWWDPILTGEDIDYQNLSIDKNGKWWKFALALLARENKEALGKAIPALVAFSGCGDTLAALRGTERLLYDVVERPDQVKAAEAYLMDMWCEVYEMFYNILKDTAEGSVSWGGFWSPGKTYMAQCDFSYMISPKMFQELFLPQIEKQTRYLDHTMYHLDGIGAFPHVPALCELPRLHGLQIVMGAGKSSPLQHLDLLKYIQSKGKNLELFLNVDEVEPALRQLSARGLYIVTSCKTETGVKTLLENATKWSHD